MDLPRLTRASLGRIAGSLAALLGVSVGLYLLFGPIGRYESVSSDGSRANATGTTSGIDYLLGAEHADPALFYWSLFIIGMALIGGYGAWTGNRFVVWTVALPLLVLSLLSMAIGLLVAPAALLFMASGVLLTLAHRAEER
jgi:hypothetical protein